MSDILIRGMAPGTVQRLKARAKRNGRSLQGEAKSILENAAELTLHESLILADQWRKKLSPDGKNFSDSAALVREGRER